MNDETLEEHNRNPLSSSKDNPPTPEISSLTDTTPLDENRLGPQQYVPQTERLGRGMRYKITSTHLKPYVTYSA